MNVTTFGKLIGLLLFCLPLLFLLSINMYTKTTRNELARLGMGTIFLVVREKNEGYNCAILNMLVNTHIIGYEEFLYNI